MTDTIAITGASSGIGHAVAERFVERGWNVAPMARRLAPLDALAKRAPDRVLPLKCDVAEEDQVEAAFSDAAERFGRIDVLFNNAGVFPAGALIDEMALSDWQYAIDVNLTGMFLAARAAFRQMRRQVPGGGRIINNGSISAQAPRPRSIAYAATKHGVTGLTRTLALDGREFDIACGQIDIGNARTELAAQLGQGALQPDGTIRPEPMIELDQVVDAVLYMADLPLSVNVPFMTVMATGMPLFGRG
ncbi:hypothetical protein C2I36_08110 [Rhodobacteraceae bacterium WD3A24]|nr:hypothetical protein C2I36_08110 [Rhodobacteraceae bacterium WD3A24]